MTAQLKKLLLNSSIYMLWLIPAFASPPIFPNILLPKMRVYITISRPLFLPVCIQKCKASLETVHISTQHTSSTIKCQMKWQVFNPLAKLNHLLQRLPIQ